MTRFAAVDLGASSGRVMLAEFAGSGRARVTLREVHRFANRPVRIRGTLYWDAPALWAGILDGLRSAGSAGSLAGIGIDSWAVDYALLDADGALLANPVHYRDGRTKGIAEALDATVPAEALYTRTGIQRLPFTTIYQLVAARDSAVMRAAAALVMIPDLFGYWLTGELGGELTNASTTGLFDLRERAWSDDLVHCVGLRRELLPAVREPGARLGTVRPDVLTDSGCPAAPVWTVASHDTASAVLGVPARGESFAFISCGTWSLVGVEVAAPITTSAAREANFSNELGVDGTVRFLRNVMGLWLLQESMRSWERAGAQLALDELLAHAARLPARRSVIDPDRLEFLPPGDLPARIRSECRRTGQPVPQSPAEITRTILDSLASAYQQTIQAAVELSGVPVDVVHLVGGGARNGLLAQLTADACQRPVVAGPVEAAAYGNVLIQARAAGTVPGDRAALRSVLHAVRTRVYRPAIT